MVLYRDASDYCSICNEPIHYIGRFWVHSATGNPVSLVPEHHDCNFDHFTIESYHGKHRLEDHAPSFLGMSNALYYRARLVNRIKEHAYISRNDYLPQHAAECNA